MIWLFGCSHGGDSASDTLDIEVVTPAEVSIPNPLVPLSRELTVAYDRDVALKIYLTSEDEQRVVEGRGTEGVFTVPLVALGADRDWDVMLEASASDHYDTTQTLTIHTDPLPDELPNLEMRVSNPEQMSPGLTLVPLRGSNDEDSFLVALDSAGDVVWYMDGESNGFQEVEGRDGELFFLFKDALIQMDWLGRTTREWTAHSPEPPAIAIQPNMMHHEVLQTSTGDFAVLTQRELDVARFPDAYDSPTYSAAHIVSDRVSIVSAAGGQTTATYDLDAMLDTARIGYDSLTMARPANGADWSHANTVTEDPDRGLWIVGARHQDAVVAFSKDSGDVAWIFANPDNWESAWEARRLQGAVDFPYHQHGVEFHDPDLLLMFDNHNVDSSPFSGAELPADSEISSRVMAYTIDPDAMTVEDRWSFELDPPVYSSAHGDADLLDNGDVLAVWGVAKYEGGQTMAELGRGPTCARVVEFDPDSGDRVWDLDVWAPAGGEGTGWTVTVVARVPDPR